jgi:hypothetical protein
MPNPFATTPTATYEIDKWSLDVQTAGQKANYFFRVGTETEMMKDFAKVDFVVCGLETITPDGNEHKLTAGSMGTNKYKKVGSSGFDSWFTTTGTPDTTVDGKDLCVIETYKLYNEGGEEITADTVNPIAQLSRDYNKFIKQDLLISLENNVADKVF